MSTRDPANTSTNTLGARLDAILAPFASDEQRLVESITEMQTQIAELQASIESSNHDLNVVQTSKIETLREAAKEDPLLSAAFMGVAAAAEAQQRKQQAGIATPSVSPPAPEPEPELKVVEDEESGHSLLNMDD